MMTNIIITRKDIAAARKAIDTLVEVGDESGIAEYSDSWDNALDVLRRAVDDAEWDLEAD